MASLPPPNIPDSSRTREHLVELDGIRGIAILMVLWNHAGWDPIPTLRTQLSALGVDLFFFLSGFLITRIRLFEQSQQISLNEFWIRRAARIFPAAYLCLLGTWTVFGSSGELICSCFYVTNLYELFFTQQSLSSVSQFWSLCCEEQFYLFWPFLLLAAGRFVTRTTFILMTLFMLCALILPVLAELAGFEKAFCDILLRRQVFTRGWPLIAGSALAVIEPYIRRSLRRECLLLGGILIFALLMMVIKYAIDGYCSLHQLTNPFGIFSKQCLMGAVLLSGIIFHDANIWSPFKLALFCWIGSISYGLYLYQWPIFHYLGHDHQTLMLSLAGIGLTFAIAIASYYLFERPIIQWSRRYTKAKRKPI